jgi:insertion element IS1 protein InsB
VKDKVRQKVMTDYWKAYKEMIEADKLEQTKRETYTVESYNGLLRHHIARLRRKTRCYSKSEEMLRITIALFIAKRNGNLSIFGY